MGWSGGRRRISNSRGRDWEPRIVAGAGELERTDSLVGLASREKRSSRNDVIRDEKKGKKRERREDQVIRVFNHFGIRRGVAGGCGGSERRAQACECDSRSGSAGREPEKKCRRCCAPRSLSPAPETWRAGVQLPEWTPSTAGDGPRARQEGQVRTHTPRPELHHWRFQIDHDGDKLDLRTDGLYVMISQSLEKDQKWPDPFQFLLRLLSNVVKQVQSLRFLQVVSASHISSPAPLWSVHVHSISMNSPGSETALSGGPAAGASRDIFDKSP
ncbi:hypothetical protein VTK26DRAFT_848 [Humicola hyalothermophila]